MKVERTDQRGHIKFLFYRPAVMLALRQLGGRAQKRDVIERVAHILPLAEVDKEQKGPKSHIHYHHQASTVRDDLVNEGLLKTWEAAGWGWWEFTDEERRAAERLQ